MFVLKLSSSQIPFCYNFHKNFYILGLLFYNGRYNGKHDFVALALEDGGVTFRLVF